jgi:DUF438 domain-containing protein
MIPYSEKTSVNLGPHTTVFALLEAYPFLSDQFFAPRDLRGARISPTAQTRRARVTCLAEVASDRDVSWRELARDIGDEIARVTGRSPQIIDSESAGGSDDARLGEMRSIAARLEDGGSLLELARELRGVTEGLDVAESAALDVALGAAAEATQGAADRRLEAAAGRPAGVASEAPPEGHPLDNLRREGLRARGLCSGMRGELERLGGSPSRRRWREACPSVTSLVDGLSCVESHFRRVQQAWFPALAVLGVEGPAALMSDRQAEALESLRRLRLAVLRDDAAFVVENGTRLTELLDDLLTTEEQVLAPLAERHLSPSDWAAVRELEDGVAWKLIPAPPPWPGV